MAERRATHASSLWREASGEDRQEILEREVLLCRQRIALLRSQGASEVSLLHWLERLQACEAELALLERVEERSSHQTGSDGEGR
ncbi:MAG: hypothetical protein ACUVXH_04080 [Anaerolineae bacterium]